MKKKKKRKIRQVKKWMKMCAFIFLQLKWINYKNRAGHKDLPHFEWKYIKIVLFLMGLKMILGQLAAWVLRISRAACRGSTEPGHDSFLWGFLKEKVFWSLWTLEDLKQKIRDKLHLRWHGESWRTSRNDFINVLLTKAAICPTSLKQDCVCIF